MICELNARLIVVVPHLFEIVDRATRAANDYSHAFDAHRRIVCGTFRHLNACLRIGSLRRQLSVRTGATSTQAGYQEQNQARISCFAPRGRPVRNTIHDGFTPVMLYLRHCARENSRFLAISSRPGISGLGCGSFLRIWLNVLFRSQAHLWQML